jgi:hypothetical protein
MVKTVNGPYGPVTGVVVEYGPLGPIKIQTPNGTILTKSNIVVSDYWS